MGAARLRPTQGLEGETEMHFVVFRRLVAGFAMVCIVLGGAPATAAPPTSASEDIQYLLDAIERSGCEFYRNGSWYAAAEARSHLASKYREVDKKQPVRSAQDFIDWVGTRSSMSGEPYRVRCPGSDAMTSAEWFRRALERRSPSAVQSH
jgi:hypothetical protein